jgi:hypothetical protein
MRLCKDCRHFIPHPSGDPANVREYSKCRLVVDVEAHENVIDGSRVEARYYYADVVRRPIGKCGPDAKLFEPK